ncbi:glycosyltransferase family 8 protein, partial [[Candida] arabinofermentans NRRL YB-2248]
AYVTLLFNDSYLPGALTLVESLKIQGTKYPIVLLYASLSDDVLEHLKRSNIFDELINIDDNLLKSNSDYHLNDILGRSDLNYTLTKLNCWNLTKFDKVIYLDLDLLILQSLDSIFDDVSINENQLAASPDSGWPDLFNSGLFLIKPSPIIFKKLLDLYSTTPSFDGADQGLLNDFFNGENWIRLPFIYNCTLSSNYEYFPALLKFISQVKTIHFIGSNKPWKSTNINTDYKLHVPNKGFKSFHELWWDVYKTTSLNELDYLDVLRLSGHLQPAPNQKLRPPPQQQEAKINKKETLTHHTYYYKIPESVPKPYDSDKGEAYMLNEPKSNNQWNTTAPVSTTTNKSKSLKKKKHLSKEELYVQSHPIFPFEKQQGR